MANEEPTNAPNPEEQSAQAAGIDGGNYDVIRRRLAEQGEALRNKNNALNAQREEVFGGTELTIIAQHSIHTEDKRLPRDMISFGGYLLFGYNVSFTFKQHVVPENIFTLHTFETLNDGAVDFPTASFDEAIGGILHDREFTKQLVDLHQYSRAARLMSLRQTEPQPDGTPGRFLAIFQTGARVEDKKVFRWNINPDGSLNYLDDRGDRDDAYPPSHDFKWIETTKEDHVEGGPHPHVSIRDKVFVETIGGDLTVKIEDNTEDGLGIYGEPVDEPDQSLSDGKILYYEDSSEAIILLKILPYREKIWRYLVFNTRTREVVRLDAIGQACVWLPEGHGLIFPGGYYLQSGEYKTFDTDIQDLIFTQTVRSPNGEDVLYVFQHIEQGRHVLLPYNLIRKEVQNPIECHGFTIFDDGRMVVFRSLNEKPETVHPVRVWQTPFTTAQFAAAAPNDGSYLSKLGNPELVRGISDVFSVCRLINNQSPTRYTYEDLLAATHRTLDGYYWLKNEEVGDIHATLQTIRRTAELIIDEFEKVVAFRERATEALSQAEKNQKEVFRGIRPENFDRVEQFLDAMSALRTQQGRLITLKEIRFIDVARLDELQGAAAERFDRVSRDCVQFLLREEAMAPLVSSLDELLEEILAVDKVRDIEPLGERLDGLNEGLALLSETVANIEVDDATVRTQILESISEVFSHLNRVRANLQTRRKTLLSKEGKAEFSAQFKLFSQSVASALSMADSPERCDEQLTRLMLQLEELEGKFSEFDEFLGELVAKREEVTEAFSTRKQTLLDERQRRIQNLLTAADRIVTGINRRARTFKEEEELNAYFASDAMVMKLRKLSAQLAELGDTVKSDELISRLKSAQQDSLRGMRDRRDLFEGGDNAIKLGKKYRFSVNTQNLDLTLVPRGEGMALHLTGTDFYEVIDDPEFNETKKYWSQQLVSENKLVYRSEYLAAQILFGAEENKLGLSMQGLHDAMRSEAGLLGLVRDFAAERYDEGYERGLHDADATLILEKLLTMRTTAGLLRFAPRPRAMACLFWAFCDDAKQKEQWHRRARSFGRLRKAFAQSPAIAAFADEMASRIAAFYEANDLEIVPGDERIAGRYILEELTEDRPHFTTSAEAEGLRDSLLAHLERSMVRSEFEEDLRALERDLTERYQLTRAWIEGFINAAPERADLLPALHETIVLLLTERRLDRQTSSAMTLAEVTDLLGQHARIREGQKMSLRLDEFLSRLGHFVHVEVPGFRDYRERRVSLTDRERRKLRIDEFMPKVMTSFVRNKLINDVYLEFIGENFAKQMGALGDGKRTDLMGLLLLISPPGYGKTTLMEYVANRLGLVFMKVNGPSLGHNVVSLDPSEAPNATAQQEVEKINLALEMGNNVMLYVDDVQHTNPEFLQKFISLCDAQRKIEGIWRGRTRTYDMRGKKFCVVMAGNPYTETGEKFRIPDMLANRADIYNLGDVLSGKDKEFALSYIENAITSNPALAPLATRDSEDTYKIIRMAQGEEIPTTDLKHGYSSVELTEIIGVLKLLFRVQEILLKVNLQYIASASVDENQRTEPSFKLQGSYRNMNKVTEKVVSAMNAEELEALIEDHYRGESQALTGGAENNLLKLAEMQGRLDDTRRKRWEEIKRTFRRTQLMGGSDNDPVARVTGSLGGLGDALTDIRATLQDAVSKSDATPKNGGSTASDPAVLQTLLESLREALLGMARQKLEVKVEHLPPPGIDTLLEQQVATIETILVPLIRATTEHLDDAQHIQKKLDELLQRVSSGVSVSQPRPSAQTPPTAISRPSTTTSRAIEVEEIEFDDSDDDWESIEETLGGFTPQIPKTPKPAATSKSVRPPIVPRPTQTGASTISPRTTTRPAQTGASTISKPTPRPKKK